MSKELKKCPLDGEDAERSSAYIFDTGIKHYVTCKTCKAQGPRMNTPEEAIAAWNRRAE